MQSREGETMQVNTWCALQGFQGQIIKNNEMNK